MCECWKPVPAYADFYQVSNQGRVRRIAGGPGACAKRVLKSCNDRDGYAFVTLCQHGHRKTQRVHPLVAHAFLGPCPDGLEVNHKNGVKDDNGVENLEYTTKSENVKHAYRVLGRKPLLGEAQVRAKLTAVAVKDIRQRYAEGGITHCALAVQYGVASVTIGRILRRERWAHVA